MGANPVAGAAGEINQHRVGAIHVIGVGQKLLDKLGATLARLEQTLAELQAVAGTDAPLPAQAGRTLEELSQTLRALRDLADTLESRPQSLIFGKEPARDE